MFKPKLSIEQGCVLRTNCSVCDNTGVGCDTKNIIYTAECKWWNRTLKEKEENLTGTEVNGSNEY